MSVTFLTMDEFLHACAYFVREGVQFRADGNALSIEFTGGF